MRDARRETTPERMESYTVSPRPLNGEGKEERAPAINKSTTHNCALPLAPGAKAVRRNGFRTHHIVDKTSQLSWPHKQHREGNGDARTCAVSAYVYMLYSES